MSTAMTYGGWVTDQPAATGSPSSVSRWVGLVAASAALTSFGTGCELLSEYFQCKTESVQRIAPTVEVAKIEQVRTPGENLMRIREVLNPAISDLATTFGVSRQSVYNWLNGEPVANENAAKLIDLAKAADILARERITVDASLMKRKFANGRTLLQVAQFGESAREAASLLVQIQKYEAEQRELMSVRFAKRSKTPATADFDLPASSDHV